MDPNRGRGGVPSAGLCERARERRALWLTLRELAGLTQPPRRPGGPRGRGPGGLGARGARGSASRPSTPRGWPGPPGGGPRDRDPARAGPRRGARGGHGGGGRRRFAGGGGAGLLRQVDGCSSRAGPGVCRAHPSSRRPLGRDRALLELRRLPRDQPGALRLRRQSAGHDERGHVQRAGDRRREVPVAPHSPRSPAEPEGEEPRRPHRPSPGVRWTRARSIEPSKATGGFIR